MKKDEVLGVKDSGRFKERHQPPGLVPRYLWSFSGAQV